MVNNKRRPQIYLDMIRVYLPAKKPASNTRSGSHIYNI